MISPRLLGLLLSALVVAATIIAGVASVLDLLDKKDPSFIANVIVNPGVRINDWVLALAVVACLTAMNVLIWNFSEKTRLAERLLQEKEEDARKTLEIAYGRIDALTRGRHIDYLTGIPNQSKFRKDVESIVANIETLGPHQVIMIDLNGFREINKKFGDAKGDDVLRLIASETYNTIRRSERAYRRSFPDGMDIKDFLARIDMYRKYPGGDEFIFVMQGHEVEALGFLQRLKRQFDTVYSPKMKDIVGMEWKLSFDAGTTPLIEGMTYKEAFDNVGKCLCYASESDLHVCWHSRLKHYEDPEFPAYDVEHSPDNAAIYARAEALFRREPEGSDATGATD